MRFEAVKSQCRKWCAFRIKPTARILAKIESEFRHIADYKKSRSLLKKHLTEEIFNLIKRRITPYGSTLLEVVLSGIENIESLIGVYAPDGEAYNVFSEIFDPIIQEFHGTTSHPVTEYGYAHKFINIDIENKHVLWLKISCNRSLTGYPFNAKLTEKQFIEIEERVSRDIIRIRDDFEGEYRSLVTLSDKMRMNLITDNYCFRSQLDSFLQEAIGFRYWPLGRGFFQTYLKNFFVWINIEDHLHIISVEMGPNFRACYRRFVTGLQRIGTLVNFMRDDRLGYLNYCPSNLGTGMQIAAQIKLFKLPKYPEIMENICRRYDIDIECACAGYKCSSFICIVTFKPKLAMNEFESVKWIQDALLHILRTELHI